MNANNIYIVAGRLDFDYRRGFTNDKGEQVYSATISKPKNVQQNDWDALKAAITELGKSAGFPFGANGKPLFRQPVKDGDDSKYSHQHGMNLIKVNTKFEVSAYGMDNHELTPPQADAAIFPGQFVKLRVKLDTYNNSGQGVAGYFQGIQIIGGGQRIEGVGTGTDERAGDDFAKASQDGLPSYMAEAVEQMVKDANTNFEDEPASAKGDW